MKPEYYSQISSPEQAGRRPADPATLATTGIASLAAGPSPPGADLPDVASWSPTRLLEWAVARWGHEVALCTSFQATGMAILDMARRAGLDLRVVTIDTGRLPQETYDQVERVRRRYGIEVEVLFPDAARVREMVTDRGPNLFRRSVGDRRECCRVRKVLPLEELLAGLRAWVTGLRRDQGAGRADTPRLAADAARGGVVKINPLAGWSEARVWRYLREHDVPVHPLYASGYTSIGCAPCTRPVGSGEGVRAGRWWWETDAHKECGLHVAAPGDDAPGTACGLHVAASGDGVAGTELEPASPGGRAAARRGEDRVAARAVERRVPSASREGE